MKKLMFVLLIILSAAMLVACDSKKSDNGGGGGGNEINTPIVADNFTTYIGNYKATNIQRVASSTITGYNTNDVKQILDYEGFLSISAASAAGINVEGAIQVGGSLFVDSDANNAPAVVPVKDFITVHALVSDVNVAAQTITFQTVGDVAGAQYIITMKKTDNNVLTQVQSQAMLWKEKGLCYQDGVNDTYANCVTNDEKEGQSGSGISNVLQSSSAVQLIGNYYLDNITIIDSKGTGCVNGATIDIQNNNLVGELSASAGLGGVNADRKLLVNLNILLKYQFENVPAGCNFPSYHYQSIDDKIPVDADPTKIDFGQIFTAEGLAIIGTQTITYNPKQRNASGELVTLDINGATVQFTFKQARTGILQQGFAKQLDNATYY